MHESYPSIIANSFRLFYLELLPQTMTDDPRNALKVWTKWTQLILIIGIIKIFTDEISWPWFLLFTCKSNNNNNKNLWALFFHIEINKVPIAKNLLVNLVNFDISSQS